MKKWKCDMGGNTCDFLKWMLTLKMLFFLLIITSSAATANANAQVRLNLEVENVTLQEVFKQITRLTGFEFVYSNNELPKGDKVTLKAEDMVLTDVLAACLKDTGLWYLIEDEIIVISPKLSNPANQQQQQAGLIVITGKVQDVDKKPIAGVSLVVKGTPVGTITSVNGIFSLRVPTTPGVELVFSFIGMKKITIPLKNRPETGEWVITMEEDPLRLDDVIVTGYQNIAKHEMTGSAKKIRAEDILQNSRVSISQMLAGEVAGMSVVLNSGEPSATPKIRIRGSSSILGNKAPLWVLDGIILDDPRGLATVENLDMNSDDAPYLIGNAIAGINPQDIEDIHVLKDASATAIYGVQAANGVIVVTTKKGRSGKPRVSYNGNISLNMRESYGSLYLMNAAERIQLSKEIIDANLIYRRFPKNEGYEGLYYAYMNKNITFEEFETEAKRMADRNTDWYALLFRDAVSNSHTVNLSGGSDGTTYYGSLGYTDSQGTPIGSLARRYTAMLRLSSWLKPEKLYINFQVNGSMSQNDGFYSGVNPDQWAYTTSRTIPLYKDDLFYYFEKDATHVSDRGPYTMNYMNELENTGQTGKVTNLTVKLDAQWNIWNGFRYEFSGSVINQKSNSVSWATELSDVVARVRTYNYEWAEASSTEEQQSFLPFGGIYSNSDSEQTSYTLKNTVAYSGDIGEDHTVGAQVTMEIRSVVANGYSATAYGWYKVGQTVDPLVTANNWTRFRDGSQLRPTITDNTKNYVSWVGMASYSYRDKLVGSFNIRMDGSNQFGENPEYRFLPVWSLGGKYTISNEPFLQGNPVLSYLAIRGSYGLQGNVDKSTSPDLVSTVAKYNANKHWWASDIRYYPNPNLRWEKTKSYNIGLEFSFFDGLFSGSLETYKKMTSDLIMNKQVSVVNGMGRFKINGGEMTNTGVEVDIILKPIRRGDWRLAVAFNYAYNRNKLTKANDDKEITLNDKLDGNALAVGETMGTIYSYRFAGLDHDTGLPLFYDMYGESTYINRLGKVSPNFTIYEQEAGLVKSGVLEAPSFGGFNINLSYKKWSLRSRFSYAFGGVKRLPIIYNIYDAYIRVYDPTFNVTKELKDRWKQPGDEAHTNIPALYDDDTYNSISKRPININLTERPGTRLYDKSDVRVAPTDNLRLNGLSLGYLFEGNNSLKSMGISSMNISFETTNLFLIADKRWHGRDPEKGASSNASLPRTFTCNIGITF